MSGCGGGEGGLYVILFRKERVKRFRQETIFYNRATLDAYNRDIAFPKL